MKKLIIAVFFLIGISAFSQTGRVGINTETPQTTLDISGKKDTNGDLLPTDMTGLQAPRLTRAELTAKGNALYGTDQKGALIYVTDVSAGNVLSQRINITTVGYYYFDGTLWQKMSGGSVYTASNGLTETSNNIVLGGTLNQTTTIATVNGATTHPLNITGLPTTGATTDNILVSSTGGQLKTIPASTFAAVNIYNANGILTSNRTVTMRNGANDYALNFTGNSNNISMSNLGAQARLLATGTTRGSLGMQGGTGAILSTLELYTDASNLAQINANGAGSLGLSIATMTARPLSFKTNGVDRMTVTSTGDVAIGATTAPSFTVGATTVQPKLHIAGDVSATGKYYTTNSTYADYVFEKYFSGSSTINPNYEFKSLNYVKDFIKTNNHLPGVESINDLAKIDNGYTFDMTKLAVQSLEKIEELYLHTIEQQDKIDVQQVEINQLKKEAEETKQRLEKLEKLLLNN